MANLIDMISQLAQTPLNVIDAYNKGVQTRRGEEDRQLQRQQLLQQIEGMIQDTRRKKAEATLQEEELLPEAVSARSKKRQADIVKSEADIEFTVPERKAGLEQTRAGTQAQLASASANRAAVNLSNIRAEGERINNQINQLKLQLASDPNNIAAQQAATLLERRKNELELAQIEETKNLELAEKRAEVGKLEAETERLEREGTQPKASSETERMVNFVSMFEGKRQRDPTWIPTPEEKVTYDRYTSILEKKGTVTGRTEQDVRDRVIYRENKRNYQQGVETLGMINTALQQVELKHGGGAGFVTATWGNLKDFIGGFWEATRGVESPDQMMEVMKRDALLNGDAEVFKMLESASQVGYTNALYTGLKYTLAKSLSEKDRIGVDDMARMDALLGGIKGGQVNKGALYAARDMIKNKAGQAYAEFKSQETGVQYGYKPEYDAVYYKSGDQWIKDPSYGR